MEEFSSGIETKFSISSRLDSAGTVSKPITAGHDAKETTTAPSSTGALNSIAAAAVAVGSRKSTAADQTGAGATLQTIILMR